MEVEKPLSPQHKAQPDDEFAHGASSPLIKVTFLSVHKHTIVGPVFASS